VNSSAKLNDAQHPQTAELSRLLTSQLGLARELQDNVNAVSIAVTQTDYDKLDRLLAAKTDVLNRLEQHNGDLQNWLLAHGYTENAISEAISTLPRNRELIEHWQEFKRVICDCQLQNGANGSIVRSRLKHKQQILNLLTGQATDAQAPYTAEGKSGEQRASRPLARV